MFGALHLIDWAGFADPFSGRLSLAIGIGAFAIAFYTATRPTPIEANERAAREQAARALAGLSEQEREDVRSLLASARFIEAVKFVRDKTGLGLKESKYLVERLRDQT